MIDKCVLYTNVTLVHYTSDHFEGHKLSNIFQSVNLQVLTADDIRFAWIQVSHFL